MCVCLFMYIWYLCLPENFFSTLFFIFIYFYLHFILIAFFLLFPSFHPHPPQEACAVGMNAALRDTDGVITAYRAHGWTYLRGKPIAEVLCELTGMIMANRFTQSPPLTFSIIPLIHPSNQPSLPFFSTLLLFHSSSSLFLLLLSPPFTPLLPLFHSSHFFTPSFPPLPSLFSSFLSPLLPLPLSPSPPREEDRLCGR